MTITVKDQIERFHQFALRSLKDADVELSLDDLYRLWRARNPSDEELRDSVAALNAAYADLEAGDTGRPARAALRETCRELGLVIDE